MRRYAIRAAGGQQLSPRPSNDITVVTYSIMIILRLLHPCELSRRILLTFQHYNIFDLLHTYFLNTFFAVKLCANLPETS